MARNSLTPIQQLPPIEYILAVIERLKLMSRSDLVEAGLEQALAAEKIWRKDLKALVDAQVKGNTAAKPVLDVKQLNSQVGEDASTMARLLKRAGLANDVNTALKQHVGTLPIAQALLELAGRTRDEAVRGLLGGFKTEVNQLAAAEDRQKNGGHPAFEPATSRAARQCWLHTDAATDLLAACLRLEGITNDPTYASRPTVKSVLRPALEVAPPTAPRRGRRPKHLGGKGSSPQPSSANGQAPLANGSAAQAS